MRALLGKGFSLIEALISLMILTFVVMFILNSLTLFPILVRKDLIHSCLREAAQAAIEYKRANPTSTDNNLTFRCQNMDIQVSITGSAPPPNECRDITATAQYRNYTYKTQDKICNF